MREGVGGSCPGRQHLQRVGERRASEASSREPRDTGEGCGDAPQGSSNPSPGPWCCGSLPARLSSAEGNVTGVTPSLGVELSLEQLPWLLAGSSDLSKGCPLGGPTPHSPLGLRFTLASFTGCLSPRSSRCVCV